MRVADGVPGAGTVDTGLFIEDLTICRRLHANRRRGSRHLTEVARNTVGDQAWQAACHRRVLGQPSATTAPRRFSRSLRVISHAGMRIANLSGRGDARAVDVPAHPRHSVIGSHRPVSLAATSALASRHRSSLGPPTAQRSDIGLSLQCASGLTFVVRAFKNASE